MLDAGHPCEQGAVIKRILYPILGQPPDPSRPPTPNLFPSRKPSMESHTPRPPPMGVKVGGKILFPPFCGTIELVSYSWFWLVTDFCIYEGRPPPSKQPPTDRANTTPHHHDRFASISASSPTIRQRIQNYEA